MLGDLVEAARADGIDCRVICSNRAYADPGRRYPRHEWAERLAVQRLATTGFGRGSTLGRVADYVSYVAGAIPALLAGPRPDVVVGLSTPPLLGALAVLLARLRRARAAYWVMDVHPDVSFALGVLSERGLTGRALVWLAGATLRRADTVVALGESMSERLRARGATDVSVVHNWADERSITPQPPEASRFREQLGARGRFLVLYSGNLGLAHEFDTLLGAAARLRGRPEVLFAFVGHGPRFDEVRQSARAQQLDNVVFHGSLPRAELHDSLAAADVHCVTLRDGLQGLLVPSKIYGILAAGRPTLYVGPASGEVHDILREGPCGTACANGDVDAVVAALRAYQDDPERRRREGASARALFESRFTRARQTAALVAILRRLERA
jgi:glycosyltransferase involved in cell wall biosynthesis